MNLYDLKIGQNVTVESDTFDSVSAVAKKNLLRYGLTPATSITLLRRSPLGSSLEILIRGTYLSISKDLAQQVRVRL